MPITVKRLSDGTSMEFEEVNPETKTKALKALIAERLAPANPRGCRLIFAGKVLISRRKLKKYHIIDGQIIEMDDTKNWSDPSSSSGSETD